MANPAEIIPHTYNDVTVQQRAKDDYFNATAMCKAAGKIWNNYWQNAATKAFVEQLAADTGIPVSELIQILRGGDPTLQGTWVHPQVAMHLAQWISPKFAVAVSGWVFERVSGRKAELSSPAELRKIADDWDRAIDETATARRQMKIAEDRCKAAEERLLLLTDDREKIFEDLRAAQKARDEAKTSLDAICKHAYREKKRYEESRADEQRDLMAKSDANNVRHLRLPSPEEPKEE